MGICDRHARWRVRDTTELPCGNAFPRYGDHGANVQFPARYATTRSVAKPSEQPATGEILRAGLAETPKALVSPVLASTCPVVMQVDAEQSTGDHGYSAGVPLFLTQAIITNFAIMQFIIAKIAADHFTPASH